MPVGQVVPMQLTRSLPCHLPDEQMGRIVGAIILPDTWQERLLTQVKLAKDARRVGKERKEAEQRLRRLGQVYLDGLIEQEEYRRQKRDLDEKIRTLVIPEVDAATAAGELVENLPALWEKANLSEKRKILMTMLDGVYVDTLENQAIVALRPKPARPVIFRGTRWLANARNETDHGYCGGDWTQHGSSSHSF